MTEFSMKIRSAAVLTAALMLLNSCSGGTDQVLRSDAMKQSDNLVSRALKLDRKGHPVDAARLFEEALTISSSIEDYQGRARILINLARIERRNASIDAAQKRITEALKNISPGSPHEAEAAHEQSQIMLARGDTHQALQWAERAVSTERGGEGGRRLNLLARARLAGKDYARAGETARQALKENRASMAFEEEATSLRLLGIIARETGSLSESQKLLLAALEQDKRAGISMKIAADLDELALTSRAAGDITSSEEYEKRAQSVKAASAALSAGERQNRPDTTRPSSKP